MSDSESTNNGLLPCPFCEGTNIKHEIYMSEGFMECKDCGAMGPGTTPDYDIKASEAAWNKRTRQPDS